MDLIRQLNETTTEREAEDALFESNVTKAARGADVDVVELTESVIEWLAQLQKDAEGGALNTPETDNTAAIADHAQAMKNKINVMGGILALLDPDMPEALNVKNPVGILKAAHSNHKLSDKAVQFLANLGRGEASGFSQKVAKLMKSPDKGALMSAIENVRNKAKKLLLIKNPPKEQPVSQPGKLGLAAKMGERPSI